MVGKLRTKIYVFVLFKRSKSNKSHLQNHDCANGMKNALGADLHLDLLLFHFPKTLESTLLNQNLIFSSLVLFISATVHYPCKVSCITAQDCSDLLHSTFYFCKALSGMNLLLKWFRHVSGFFFPQRLCLIFS